MRMRALLLSLVFTACVTPGLPATRAVGTDTPSLERLEARVGLSETEIDAAVRANLGELSRCIAFAQWGTQGAAVRVEPRAARRPRTGQARRARARRVLRRAVRGAGRVVHVEREVRRARGAGVALAEGAVSPHRSDSHRRNKATAASTNSARSCRSRPCRSPQNCGLPSISSCVRGFRRRLMRGVDHAALAFVDPLGIAAASISSCTPDGWAGPRMSAPRYMTGSWRGSS